MIGFRYVFLGLAALGTLGTPAACEPSPPSPSQTVSREALVLELLFDGNTRDTSGSERHGLVEGHHAGLCIDEQHDQVRLLHGGAYLELDVLGELHGFLPRLDPGTGHPQRGSWGLGRGAAQDEANIQLVRTTGVFSIKATCSSPY